MSRPLPKKFGIGAHKSEREMLLTAGNPKLQKGLRQGYLAWLMHLSPANLSGTEMCKWRSPNCTAACLNLSGHGGFDAQTKAARLNRTRWFLEDPDSFVRVLIEQIGRARRYSEERHNLTMSMRLNGTSDVPWEVVAPEIFAAHPDLQFYDYTKGVERLFAPQAKNYHLTFSYSEKNADACREAFRVTNVAMVFDIEKGMKLPARDPIFGRRVIDGDLDDLRFLDRPRKGVIVGLRFKEIRDAATKAKREQVARRGGFFVKANPAVEVLGSVDYEVASSPTEVYAYSQTVVDPKTGEDLYVR